MHEEKNAISMLDSVTVNVTLGKVTQHFACVTLCHVSCSEAPEGTTDSLFYSFSHKVWFRAGAGATLFLPPLYLFLHRPVLWHFHPAM